MVLQKVGRSEGGVYTCTAHNSEGDGVSNSMSLDVKCKYKLWKLSSNYNNA